VISGGVRGEGRVPVGGDEGAGLREKRYVQFTVRAGTAAPPL